MYYEFLLMAPPQGGGGGGIISMMLPFIIIIGIMYFLIIRPQQKEQQKHKEMLENVQKGDKVITNGGISGIITNIKNNKNTVVLKTQDTKLEIVRDYIAKVLPKEE
jgi:preprotein translocase subunit YajC